MKLRRETIKRLIQEELSNILENIHGKMGILYHGSSTEPVLMQKIINTGTMRSSKALFGKGIYAIYEEDITSKVFQGAYGNYIYKLKQNLNNFISFDYEPCKKIYGKSLTPYEQLVSIGKKTEADRIISKGKKYKEAMTINPVMTNGEFTTEQARILYNELQYIVPGIIFNQVEGKTVVIFNVKNTVMLGYAETFPGNQEKLKFKKIDYSQAETLPYKSLKSSSYLDKEDKIESDLLNMSSEEIKSMNLEKLINYASDKNTRVIILKKITGYEFPYKVLDSFYRAIIREKDSESLGLFLNALDKRTATSIIKNMSYGEEGLDLLIQSSKHANSLVNSLMAGFPNIKKGMLLMAAQDSSLQFQKLHDIFKKARNVDPVLQKKIYLSLAKNTSIHPLTLMNLAKNATIYPELVDLIKNHPNKNDKVESELMKASGR